MAYLGTLVKKEEPRAKTGYLGTLVKKAPPPDYSGTLGDSSRLLQPSFATKTSTQAIPDVTTPSITPKSLAQGIGRSYLAAGQTLINLRSGRSLSEAASIPFVHQPADTTLGKISRAVTGTDQPISATGEDVATFGENIGTKLGGAGTFAFLGLDFLGGGAPKALIRSLRLAKTAEEAAKVMKAAGFTDDVVKNYASMFAREVDEVKIAKRVEEARGLQKTMAEAGTGEGLSYKWKIEGGDSQDAFVRDIAYPARSVEEKLNMLNKMPEPTPERIRQFYNPTPEQIVRGRTMGIELPTVETVYQNIVRGIPAGGIVKALTGFNFEVKKLPITGKGATKTTESYYAVWTEGPLKGRPIGASGKTKEDLFSQIERLNRDTGLGANLPTSPSTPPRRAPVAPDAAAARTTLQTSPEGVPRGGEPLPIPPPSVSLPELKHISGENARGFKQVKEIGAKTTKEPRLYQRVATKLAKAFNSTVEVVQDKERLVRKLMERKDMKVSDATNVYQKMTLYAGRTARKVELAHERMEQVANDIVNIAHDSGREVADVRADINSYLHAVHAPERNLALGDGAAGMTTAQAVKELERINALPNAAEIKRAAEDMRKLNREGLNLLKEAGVISDEFYETLVTKYKNHVPLNRIFEGEDIQSALSIRGYDVRSTGIKKAKGSEREVADILANIQHNYEQAVLRSEKNIVDQATLGFVRENKDALGGLMKVKKPRAIGKDFKGRILMERTTDPQYLQLYENGKPVWIYITDPDLAATMRGVGADKLPKVLHAVGAFTRLMSGLATRFNPEFALPNKLRDLQETMVYAAAQKDLGFRGAAKLAAKDPASVKAVAEFYLGRETVGTRLYKEMQELGGTTGGLGLSTRKQVELDIDKMIATAASRPRQMFADMVMYIDNWNAIFEDSTRLSTYKQALAQGASKERAAFLAKEASINFNRMGRGGSIINALYMFSNASIQGSAKMIRSLRNPKVAATVVTAVGASVAAANEWNDFVDPQWRDKVTRWDRLNSLPVMIPNGRGEGATYISVPVSWGIKPIKVMADFAYDAASGVSVDAARVAGDLFTSVLEAYNPLGGTDFASTLVPTIADMPVEIARNQSWSGSKIRPDFDQNAPADVQYFKNLGETASGQLFIAGTKQLQEMTGIAISPADVKYVFENLIGGAGRFGVKSANTALGFASGEPVPLDEYPFVSRFYRERTEEETGQGAGGDIQEVNKLLQTQSRERFYIKQEAEKLYEQWNALPKAEAKANWQALNRERPEVAKKITEVAQQEAKGLTYFERQIVELGVENGERAKYLYGKFNELKTTEEKKALWEQYAEKKIISDEVAKQLKYLIAHPEVLKQSNAGTGPSASNILGALTGARRAQAAEVPQQNYYVRDNTISEQDMNEARAILFGEVSSRPTEKQMLEAQTILNTAFNRMDEFRKHGQEKTLAEVLQMDNQYQAYKGKQYQRYKEGKATTTEDKRRIAAIEKVIEQVRGGNFQNNVPGYFYYKHLADGRIMAQKKPLFKK